MKFTFSRCKRQYSNSFGTFVGRQRLWRHARLCPQFSDMQQESCKMATVGDSPAKYAGQPWTVWAENVPLKDDVGKFETLSTFYTLWDQSEVLGSSVSHFRSETCTLVLGVVGNNDINIRLTPVWLSQKWLQFNHLFTCRLRG